MYLEVGTTDIPTVTAHTFGRGVQIWLWLALFASFAVKLPMWPFHTWLPDAHVEAPTAGSVILGTASSASRCRCCPRRAPTSRRSCSP
jgi:NADH-quinone oxidoreductase subunit M